MVRFCVVVWVCGYSSISITSFGDCTRPQHPETFKGVFDQFTVSRNKNEAIYVQTHAKTLTLNIVGPTMLGVVASVPNNTLSQQHSTNRVCKRTQHVTSNNVGSSLLAHNIAFVCTGLNEINSRNHLVWYSMHYFQCLKIYLK